MDLITSLSRKTLDYFDVENIINDTFTEKTYLFIQKIVRFIRKKDIIVTKDNIMQLAEFGLIGVYSDFFKFVIVLSIAYWLNIFLPTFLIMNIFSLLRGFAGGNHMSTFNKCFALMIFSFISLGVLISKVNINIEYIIISYIFSLIYAWKYAPMEREDKTDKDCDNGNRFKKITIALVLLGLIVSIALYISNYTEIANSIAFGVLLEMMTVTPWGIKFFTRLDGGLIKFD